MKHVLSILFLSLAFALSAQAQTYAVFSVRGDVRMMNNKKSIPLKLRQDIHASDNVIVPVRANSFCSIRAIANSLPLISPTVALCQNS